MLISYWSSDVCSSDLLDGHSRRRSQSLVSYGHELSRHHRVARDVRLHRQVGRRLVALRRSGKIAPADGLAPTRLRSRLEPPAAPDEWHQLLLCAHGPVALRAAKEIEREYGKERRCQYV